MSTPTRVAAFAVTLPLVFGGAVALGGTVTDGASRGSHESRLGLTATRGGRTVPIEDYLGARGHLVSRREGDLAFLHVHPYEDSLRFMATFPSAGPYRLFLQFRAQGRLRTAASIRVVSR